MRAHIARPRCARPHHQRQRRRRNHRVRRQGSIRGGGLLAPSSLATANEDQFATGCIVLLATARNDLVRMAQLLDATPSLVNFSDYDRRTPLHAACRGPPDRRDGAGAARRAAQPLGPVGRQPARRRDAPPPRGHGEVPARVGRARRRRRPSARADHRQLIGRGRVGGDAARRREAVEGRYDKRTALHLAASEGHAPVVQRLPPPARRRTRRTAGAARPWTTPKRRSTLEVIELLIAPAARRASGGRRSPRRSSRPQTSTRRDAAAAAAATATAPPCRHPAATPPPPHRHLTAPPPPPGADDVGEVGRAADARADRQRRLRRHLPLPVAGTMVAAKVINVAKVKSEERDLALSDFRKETNFLQQLRHPNVCMLLGYTLTEHEHEVMLSELMQCSPRRLQDLARSREGGGATAADEAGAALRDHVRPGNELPPPLLAADHPPRPQARQPAVGLLGHAQGRRLRPRQAAPAPEERRVERRRLRAVRDDGRDGVVPLHGARGVPSRGVQREGRRLRLRSSCTTCSGTLRGPTRAASSPSPAPRCAARAPRSRATGTRRWSLDPVAGSSPPRCARRSPRSSTSSTPSTRPPSRCRTRPVQGRRAEAARARATGRGLRAGLPFADLRIPFSRFRHFRSLIHYNYFHVRTFEIAFTPLVHTSPGGSIRRRHSLRRRCTPTSRRTRSHRARAFASRRRASERDRMEVHGRVARSPAAPTCCAVL